MAVRPIRSQSRRRLLKPRSMPRWTALLGALMLVLMLWTGSAAHAVEQLDCVPVAADTIGHYDGDTDQVPADPDKGVAHHHAGCSGHQLAAPASSDELQLSSSGREAPFAVSSADLAGRTPDAQLRPPIA